MSKQISQEQVNRAAWAACDTFRGTLDPAHYKDYILTMLFLKFMSDLWEDKAEEYATRYKGDETRVQRALSRERFVMPNVELKDNDGEVIESFPASFGSLYERRERAGIGDLINETLVAIEDANRAKLEHVFRNIDFNSEAFLGQTKDRNRRLKNMLEDFHREELSFRKANVGNLDILGNTYEFLIKNFAADAGKKAGEFFTPPEVSDLLAQLVEPKSGDRICDPTCGSGSLLLKVADQIPDGNCALYGQESNGSTWALCRMNMFLHERDSATIKWNDTINNPQLIEDDALMKFNVVVANPPFSLDKWGAEDAASDKYRRFWRGTPPKSKGDYAFICHMIETTIADTGRVGVVVPHGVLFRGGSEGKIRQQLIEENLLKAVIGLPANLFFGAGIPTALMIFDRGKTDDKVLFIDASREFDKATNQNVLSETHMDEIVKVFKARKSKDKYAHLASLAEIRENEFNLNIPRYVDTFEPEEEIDIGAVQVEIETLEAELAKTRKQMGSLLKGLNL